jgi:phosphate transport system permease protein
LSREALLLVPDSQREAMYALGATRWEVLRKAVLPYARSGIFGAVVLSMGRALGETMAIAMVIGGGFQFPKTLFDQGYTLASVIANEFNEVSSDMYLSALIEAGLILLVLTSLVNIGAYFIMRRMTLIHGAKA